MPRKILNGEPGARKYHNITLDVASATELREFQAKLGEQLGFEPTYSQTVKYLIRKTQGKL